MVNNGVDMIDHDRNSVYHIGDQYLLEFEKMTDQVDISVTEKRKLHVLIQMDMDEAKEFVKRLNRLINE